MLHHAIHSPFKDNIKFSITALGEWFAANLSMTSLALNIPPYTHVRLGWYNDYIKQGGRIAMCLIAEGWCQSELNKIRSAYMGLNTVHFLSQLRRTGPKRDHSLRDQHKCVAFQINHASYQPAHAEGGCEGRGCCLPQDCTSAVTKILFETESYILSVHPSTKKPGGMQLLAERFTPRMQYVAISHV
jgi:hypothetical protein